MSGNSYSVLNAMVDESETTVVMVEHKLEWVAAFADRVIHMKAGSVVADGPANEVLASKEAMELGLEGTYFTSAARAAREAGLIKKRDALPLTIDQSRAFFS